MKPIITALDLKQLLTTTNVIIIDAGSGPESKQRFEQEHLAGAQYVDLNTDLSNVPQNPANGGRHPLPKPEVFSSLLGKLGINPKTHVIVYDDKNGSNAATRFWWMLRAAGHKQIQVLSGGLQAAKNAEIEVNSKQTEAVTTSPYPFTSWLLPLKTMDNVKNDINKKHKIIIDVRDNDRFLGLSEPIDLIAGHIPSAVNMPFKSHLNPDGTFVTDKQLEQMYSSVFLNYKAENITVHCGSGVTACHTLLAIAQCGREIPALYVGSWSEWSRNMANQGDL